MIRRILFVALVVSGLAAAAPPPAAAPKASPEDLNACSKALEARSACKEDLCQMQTETIAKQMGSRVPAVQLQSMQARMKASCLSHMDQEGKDAAARQEMCQRMASVGSIHAVVAADKACSSKKSCKERAACIQPFLQKEGERQHMFDRAAPGSHARQP